MHIFIINYHKLSLIVSKECMDKQSIHRAEGVDFTDSRGDCMHGVSGVCVAKLLCAIILLLTMITNLFGFKGPHSDSCATLEKTVE
jgi:hypothetical protein